MKKRFPKFYLLTLLLFVPSSNATPNKGVIAAKECVSNNYTCIFYETGSLKKISAISSSKKNGIERIYSKDGDLIGKVKYKNGLVHGDAIGFYGEDGYEIGVKESIIHWEYGKVLGPAKWFGEGGELNVFFTPLYAIEILEFNSNYSCSSSTSYSFGGQTRIDSYIEYNSQGCGLSFNYPIISARSNKFTEFKASEKTKDLNRQFYKFIQEELLDEEPDLRVADEDDYYYLFLPKIIKKLSKSIQQGYSESFYVKPKRIQGFTVFSWSKRGYFGGTYDSFSKGVLILLANKNKLKKLSDILKNKDALILSKLKHKYTNISAYDDYTEAERKNYLINKIKGLKKEDLPGFEFELDQGGNIIVHFGHCGFTSCAEGFSPDVNLGALSNFL